MNNADERQSISESNKLAQSIFDNVMKIIICERDKTGDQEIFTQAFATLLANLTCTFMIAHVDIRLQGDFLNNQFVETIKEFLAAHYKNSLKA